MRDMTKITEQGKKLMKVLKKVLVEQAEEEYYKIPAKEFQELMKLSGYHGKGLSKIKKFGGKPIWVTGDLDLSNTPTDSLGNVKYIEGKLDIRNTNISDLSGVEIKSYTWDNGTPIEKRRLAAILRGKMNDAQERRQSDEWSIEGGDDTGLKANALYQSLVNNREIEEMDEDEIEKLESMKSELEILKKQYDESEDHDNELYDKISELEDEIEQKESQNVDLYNLIPMKYSYYGLDSFEIIGVDGLRGSEYAVGDEYETDRAAMDYAENYIGEVGIEGLNRHFVEDYLDTDSIENMFRDHYYDDVRDNPESYFDESEMPTSQEQDDRKEELEEYIEKVKGVIEKLEQKQESLNDEIEDPDEYSKQYDELQSRIDILQGHIDDSEQEIEDMVPEGEVTTQMVEDKVDEIVSDKMNDPADSLREWGIDIYEYIDKEELAKGLVSSDGYQIMASYDGSYDTEYVNSKLYYIFRIN
jgi:predicted nuclease with TOPRIM domain